MSVVADAGPFLHLRWIGCLFRRINARAIMPSWDFCTPLARMKPTAFLSHSSADRIFVHRLAEELEASGVEVWLDEHQLRLGDWLAPSLRTALHKSDYVIVVVSPDAVRSTWVEREVSVAERHARRTGGKPVLIPVLLSQVRAVDMQKVVGDRLYADFREEDGFFLALAKVLERMGLQQSFSSRLARLDEIEPVLMRTASTPAIQTGRDILADLAHEPVLDVPEYRNWIIWELVRRVCRGKYPIEVVIRGGSRPHCRIFDDFLGRIVNVHLSESELAAGVWQFTAGGDSHRNNLSPSKRQRPKAKSKDVFTHLGLSGDAGRLENPWHLAGSERAQTRVVRTVLKKLCQVGPAVARSLLIDWQLVALGRHGHEMRIRWGSAIVPSSSKDGPFCVHARGPRHPPPGDRAGITFLEIETPFFRTRNTFFVCQRHGSPRWQGAFNAMTTGENAILPTYRAKVHPELYSLLVARERNAQR